MSTLGSLSVPSPSLPSPAIGEAGSEGEDRYSFLPDILQVPVRRRVHEEVVRRLAGTVAIGRVDDLDERAAFHHQPLELVQDLIALGEVRLSLRLAVERVDLRVFPARVIRIRATV